MAPTPNELNRSGSEAQDAVPLHCLQGLKETVQSVLQGFNATIMAFGQTGSGKTHTLLGDVADPHERGVVPRAVAELAQGIASCPEQCSFKVCCAVWSPAGCCCGRCIRAGRGNNLNIGPPLQVTLSVIEIYNERIRDLLHLEKDNLQVKCSLPRALRSGCCTPPLVGKFGPWAPTHAPSPPLPPRWCTTGCGASWWRRPPPCQ